MVKYHLAAAIVWLASAPGDCFTASTTSALGAPTRQTTTTTTQDSSSSRMNLSTSSMDYGRDKGVSIGEAFENMGSSYLNTISEAVTSQDDEVEEQIAEKRENVKKRFAGTYEVTLALQVAQTPLAESIGITLCQVDEGLRFSKVDLSMDTLTYGQLNRGDDSIEMIEISELKKDLDGQFKGIIVSSVKKEGKGWEAGIRAGDILVSSSATLGEAMWPKTSLAGVKSAMVSRRVMSGNMSFQFQRRTNEAVTANQYELTLSRPLGLEIEETKDGYVEVRGFKDNAPRLARHAIQLGDRILAVESSIGEIMWPVSTVEGVISACTSRLPGQSVRLRLERPKSVMQQQPSMVAAVAPVVPQTTSSEQIASTVDDKSVDKREQLLKKCTTVLLGCLAEAKASKHEKFSRRNKVLPAIADKVVDAIASASISMSDLTVGVVMDAYIKGNQPLKAIRLFEAAVGIRANGYPGPPRVVIHGKKKGTLQPSTDALNVIACANLMKAHTLNRDYRSVRRVLNAIGGIAITRRDGTEVTAWWPGTEDGSLVANTHCCNIAMDAAVKAWQKRGIRDVLRIFATMKDPDDSEKGGMTRDIVTYNIVIRALTTAGRFDEAFDLFYAMRSIGMKPDQNTFVSLVKSCVQEGDMQELLYDMKERGVKPDIGIFNVMIRTLCDRRQLDEAREMVLQMDSLGVSPDAITYTFLMTGLNKAKRFRSCLALFDTACADPRTAALTNDIPMYTTAISAAAACGDLDKAFELVNRMTAAGIKPTVKTLTALLFACKNTGNAKLAVEIFGRINEPDGLAASAAIEAHCMLGEFEKARDILVRQECSRYPMNGNDLWYAYKCMFRYSLDSGDYNFAREAFTLSLEEVQAPTKSMFDSIAKTLKIWTGKSKGKFSKLEYIPPESFRFALFVLDSIATRSRLCDGLFYVSLLESAMRMGPIEREIVNLMPRARAQTVTEKNADVIETESSELREIGWEELYSNYDDLRDQVGVSIKLPRLDVRLTGSKIEMIKVAERDIAWKRSRSSR